MFMRKLAEGNATIQFNNAHDSVSSGWGTRPHSTGSCPPPILFRAGHFARAQAADLSGPVSDLGWLPPIDL